VLVRKFKCPACGAPRESAGDALLVLCEFCGSVIGMDTEGRYRGAKFVEMVRDQTESFMNPTATQARMNQVAADMQRAGEGGDRESWRVLAREYYALLAARDPSLVPGGVSDPSRLATWYREAMFSGEMMTFDPEVRAAQAAYTGELTALMQGEDPVESGNRMLEAARRMYTIMVEHPDRPENLLTEGASHHAREMVRAALSSLAATLGEGVVTTIRREVLGDENAGGGRINCGNCGAELARPAPGESKVQCPYCGGIVEMQTEDPWVASTVTNVLVALDHMRRAGQDEDHVLVPMVIWQILMPLQQGQKVDPASAWSVLQQTLPDVAPKSLQKAIQQVRQSQSPGSPQATLLDDLLARIGT